jgi:hypothetical protein
LLENLSGSEEKAYDQALTNYAQNGYVLDHHHRKQPGQTAHLSYQEIKRLEIIAMEPWAARLLSPEDPDLDDTLYKAKENIGRINAEMALCVARSSGAQMPDGDYHFKVGAKRFSVSYKDGKLHSNIKTALRTISNNALQYAEALKKFTLNFHK